MDLLNRELYTKWSRKVIDIILPAYTDENKFTTEHNRQDVKENIYRHAFSSIIFLFSISGGHKLSV